MARQIPESCCSGTRGHGSHRSVLSCCELTTGTRQLPKRGSLCPGGDTQFHTASCMSCYPQAGQHFCSLQFIQKGLNKEKL